MTRDHEELQKRPERVVILDADDPMTEIHGRFVWQEEHDRAVAEARQAAFAEGYESGLRDGAVPTQVVVRRRSTLRRRLRLAGIVALVLIVLLMLPVVLI